MIELDNSNCTSIGYITIKFHASKLFKIDSPNFAEGSANATERRCFMYIHYEDKSPPNSLTKEKPEDIYTTQEFFIILLTEN